MTAVVLSPIVVVLVELRNKTQGCVWCVIWSLLSDCTALLRYGPTVRLGVCSVQFTEERLGQAERTEPDADLERLAGRADATRLWTERICRQTEVLLRPNPGTNPISPRSLD